MGGFEAWRPVCVEPTLKYRSLMLAVLAWAPVRGCGQCMVGSLTGAVSSQSVTEDLEGQLILVGHREFSAMA